LIGSDFFRSAFAALQHRSADMNTLVVLGLMAAYSYSVMILLLPDFVTENMSFQGVGHLYFDGAAMIVSLVLLGRLLEFRARRKASQAICKLLALQPPVARVVQGDDFIELPVAALQNGDLVQIRPGERLPVDGELLTGTTTVDESMLTGESLRFLIDIICVDMWSGLTYGC
jgi:Cu+-exporting ATPase